MKNKAVFVFDTNLFVSVALFNGATVKAVLKKAAFIGWVVVSASMLSGLADALMRTKFDK